MQLADTAGMGSAPQVCKGGGGLADPGRRAGMPLPWAKARVTQALQAAGTGRRGGQCSLWPKPRGRLPRTRKPCRGRTDRAPGRARWGWCSPPLRRCGEVVTTTEMRPVRCGASPRPSTRLPPHLPRPGPSARGACQFRRWRVLRFWGSRFSKALACAGHSRMKLAVFVQAGPLSGNAQRSTRNAQLSTVETLTASV